MGKPKAPAPPDYAAAAKEQGAANLNSALGTNYLNQANQSGPYGSLTYSYSSPGSGQGHYLPDGTYIPQTTATTTLAPDQQRLLDQQTNIGIQLNDLASRGIGYVDQASQNPIDQSKLPSLKTGLAATGDSAALRDKITEAYMARLQPSIDRDRAALDTKLANQGLAIGSQAYGTDQTLFQQGVNDQRMAALLAGDQAQQFERDYDLRRGLADADLTNRARAQSIQEADYFKNQPLNMLNALRSGNQVTTPQFGNVSAGAQIQAAPIYQATADQYSSALDAYKTKMAGFSGLMSGLGSIGGAAIGKWG